MLLLLRALADLGGHGFAGGRDKVLVETVLVQTLVGVFLFFTLPVVFVFVQVVEIELVVVGIIVILVGCTGHDGIFVVGIVSVGSDLGGRLGQGDALGGDVRWGDFDGGVEDGSGGQRFDLAGLADGHVAAVGVGAGEGVDGWLVCGLR